MNHAIITSVWKGIESTTEIKDQDITMFYAKITGAVKGLTFTDSIVTKLEITE